MDEAKLQTVEQIKAFHEEVHEIAIKIPKAGCYDKGVNRALTQVNYSSELETWNNVDVDALAIIA